MFEVKVTKRVSYQISDFRGVLDPKRCKTERALRDRLIDLGAGNTSITDVLADLEDGNTATVLISPSKWNQVESGEHS